MHIRPPTNLPVLAVSTKKITTTFTEAHYCSDVVNDCPASFTHVSAPVSNPSISSVKKLKLLKQQLFTTSVRFKKNRLGMGAAQLAESPVITSDRNAIMRDRGSHLLSQHSGSQKRLCE